MAGNTPQRRPEFNTNHMPPGIWHPALLAETFVDPSRFEGTCYRAPTLGK